MYEMIATAASGLAAGVGLHAAIAGAPSGLLTPSARSYHARTRFLNISLAAASCGCAGATYHAEGRGDLWLVASVGSALSIPYHLLLMSTPTEAVSLAGAGPDADAETAAAALGLPTEDSTVPPTPVPGGGASLAPPKPRRQLAYARSGALLSPAAAEGSWVRRYWFGAALSCASFAAMMAIMASRRETSAFVAPF